MRLLEHQAKQCLAEAGVAVPQSDIIESATVVPTAPIVLKSQVPIGGRGKAGGVVIVREQSAVTPTIQRLFALDIGGHTPTKLLAEEVLSIAQECYISLTINREQSSIELLAHTSGGIDVEEHDRAAFFRQAITPQTVHTVTEALAEYLSLPEQAFALEDMVANCLRCFINNDCLLLEINPLVVTTDGQLIAGDAKMTIDDAALFRHPQWHEAALEDHNFVTLDHNGTVATIANGAGRCDAAELNRVMTSYYTTQKCYYRSNKAGGTYCQDTIESYVRNAYPSYCQAYFDHDWTTAADAVKFVGKEKKGGKWVNVR